MSEINQLFPEGYEASRNRFRKAISTVRKYWPEANLYSHLLNGELDLSIDWIQAEAHNQPEKYLVFTTGEHGIEGYVGAAMLELFIQDYLAQLNPQNTGILLVHAINPWGMKHRRRVNAQNVDINRNFIWGANRGEDAELFSVLFENHDYELINSYLNPTSKLDNLFKAYAQLVVGVLWNILRLGANRLRQGVLLGQYQYPEGIYFGGETLQEETLTMMTLFRENIGRYQQILVLDMHTGYGPANRMSLVNSMFEPRLPDDFRVLFKYPQILRTGDSSFYTMQGDMIDYLYRFVQNEFPDKRLYATSFEFGTFGDSILAGLQSLWTMILENQIYWFGTGNSGLRKKIISDFHALYAPVEYSWRKKAINDAQQAFDGILHAEGYLIEQPHPTLQG